MWLGNLTSKRFFGREQRKQIDALFGALLPGSDTAPGAADVGAAEYLDRLLALDDTEYYEIRDWRKLYTDALPALDAASVTMFRGRSTAQLSQDEVTTLLTGLSRGELSGFPEGFDQRRFFATLRGHCIEGCFADPRWGGNQNGLMWRWFGYLQKPQDFRRTSQMAVMIEEAMRHADRQA
jgi:gluconate 2-dehydrogenase gamma chain